MWLFSVAVRHFLVDSIRSHLSVIGATMFAVERVRRTGTIDRRVRQIQAGKDDGRAPWAVAAEQFEWRRSYSC